MPKNWKGIPMEERYPWSPAFLAALRNSGNIRAACHVVGIQRRMSYQARDNCAPFRKAWDEAMVEAVEVLEAEARRRAMSISDTLLIFLLKAHKPAMYRETKYEHVLSGGDSPIRKEVKHLGPDYDEFAAAFVAAISGHGNGVAIDPGDGHR